MTTFVYQIITWAAEIKYNHVYCIQGFAASITEATSSGL